MFITSIHCFNIVFILGRPLAPQVISTPLSDRRHIYNLTWTPGANLKEALQDTINIGAYDILYRKTWVEVCKEFTSDLVFSYQAVLHD